MDLFRCDRCQRIGKMSDKKGRLIIQELGTDGLPHPNYYNRKAEVCLLCLGELQSMMNAKTPKPDYVQSTEIMRDAHHAMIQCLPNGSE